MVRLSVPGKTFLLGEYAALAKGPALLLNTGPRFELRVNPRMETIAGRTGLSVGGPVAEYLRQQPVFEELDLVFTDPYAGLGGFGASAAQFVLLYAYKRLLERSPVLESDLLAAYKASVTSTRGIMPSGYDLLSQVLGKVTHIDPWSDRFETLNWDFDDLEFILIRTGRKVPTHTHLDSLDAKLDVEELFEPVHEARRSLEKRDSSSLVASIRKYDSLLRKRGWVAPETIDLLDRLSGVPTISAAKGCGAMGADVVVALCKTADLVLALQQLRSLGLSVVATSRNLSAGLRIENRTGPSMGAGLTI